ncbi:hypothetical protein [Streptomyces sp. NPDC048419]|uniref:hypothetical protein n=1 Tax=Streptomyces sp. NPDC048419 TaxID=3365547 RepID=UPI0037163D12
MLGLLEAREQRAREEIARLREKAQRVQAALRAVEGGLGRLVDARATVAEVSAEPEPVSGAVAGAVVSQRAGDMAASVLAPDYQQILSVLESEAGREGMRFQHLAVALGLDAAGRRPARRPLMSMVIDHGTIASCMAGRVS